MKVLIAILLLLQLSPPTKSIKRRHGQSAKVAWDFVEKPEMKLLFFSVKSTSNLNVTPIEFKQVPRTVRETEFIVLFHPSNPKTMYYVVSAVYDGQIGESFPSNTVLIERIGPPQ